MAQKINKQWMLWLYWPSHDWKFVGFYRSAKKAKRFVKRNRGILGVTKHRIVKVKASK